LFYTIETINNHTISVTRNHLIRVHDQSQSYVSAETLKLNDLIYEKNGVPVKIKSIKTSYKQGIYAPVTLSGHLMVNNGGLLASCYVEYKPLHVTHHLLHRILLPYRLWYSLTSKWLPRPQQQSQTESENKIHWLVLWLYYNRELVRLVYSMCTAITIYVAAEFIVQITYVLRVMVNKQIVT
ncbi:unnamed protein product, partial [Didymodactylos carnosus]